MVEESKQGVGSIWNKNSWHWEEKNYSEIAKEFLNSVAEGLGNLISYHAEWIRLSGVSESAAVTHSHKNLMEILKLMHYRDQLDISALAAGEFIVRWAVQLEVPIPLVHCCC